ncbi:hypothetical protein GCM10009119_20050 [Algoriphagus jejuensis]|uniref:Uncharacterized protein n=1 Tax=Algoriphagus jejuensis TaxID=419934 RepID=A0ABP3YD37_9BACT
MNTIKLSQPNTIGYRTATSLSEEKRFTTMAIINTGLRLWAKVCVYLKCPPNLFDLALRIKKIKQNKKFWLRA